MGLQAPARELRCWLGLPVRESFFCCVMYLVWGLASIYCVIIPAFPGGSDVKESAWNAGETRVQSLGQEDPLEKEMATHSSILAWRIPWTV